MNSLTRIRLAAVAVALAGAATAVPASAAAFCAAAPGGSCSYTAGPRASMVLVSGGGPWTVTWTCSVTGTRTAGGFRNPRVMLRAHDAHETCLVEVKGTAVAYAGPAPVDRVPIDE